MSDSKLRISVVALAAGLACAGCEGVDWEGLVPEHRHKPEHGGSPPRVWQELGAGQSVLDRDGRPGLIVRPTFIDAYQPHLMSAVVCPADALDARNWLRCRPATSQNRGATFVLHDAPVFDEIEANGWGNWSPPVVVRSPVDTQRMYFAASGHPWDTPAPKGGLWRSDDDGRSWTPNLVAGQPGESGEIVAVVPHPNDASGVYINRGYDFGNVAVSHDAGATFSIICGNNNVEKTTEDIWCAHGGSLALDFSRQRLTFKHFFLSVSVTLRLDGTEPRTLTIPGLTSPGEGAFIAVQDVQFDAPLSGLPPRPIGGRSFRFSADGSWAVFVDGDDNESTSQRLWRDTADFSAGQELSNVIPGGSKLVFTHPLRACTWVVQVAPTALTRTRDCGETWTPISTTGFSSTSPIIAGAYAPDHADTLVLFTKNGQRFRASVP